MDADRTESLRAEAREHIATRDLRYYGWNPWNNADADRLREAIEQQPASQADVLAELYLLALDSMDEGQLADVLLKTKRCPPKRGSA